jgi:hypothetical protein
LGEGRLYQLVGGVLQGGAANAFLQAHGDGIFLCADVTDVNDSYLSPTPSVVDPDG